MRAIVEVVKLCLPVSHFDTSESRLPNLLASSCCVMPFCFNTASNLSAIPYDKSNSALCSCGIAERHCLNSSFVIIAPGNHRDGFTSVPIPPFPQFCRSFLHPSDTFHSDTPGTFCSHYKEYNYAQVYHRSPFILTIVCPFTGLVDEIKPPSSKTVKSTSFQSFLSNFGLPLMVILK